MDTLENKKILVTGGKGYLGSRLITQLTTEGAKVYSLSLEPSRHEWEYRADICDAEQVADVVNTVRPDFIYHLAASLDRRRTFDHYDEIMEVNVTGTLNLLKALQKIEYKNLIFTSSSEVYGNSKSPFTEDLPLKPASPYSLSKVYGELLISTFSDIYNKNYTILRIFNFYGENMPESFFIPQLISTLSRNENFKMTRGEQKRDFLYVGDVVQALILAAKRSNSYRDTYNVCSGEGTELRQLADEASRNIQGRGRVLYGAIPYRENEIWEMIGDSTKIKKKLKFSAKFSLDQGIKLCIENRIK